MHANLIYKLTKVRHEITIKITRKWTKYSVSLLIKCLVKSSSFFLRKAHIIDLDSNMSLKTAADVRALRIWWGKKIIETCDLHIA